MKHISHILTFLFCLLEYQDKLDQLKEVLRGSLLLRAVSSERSSKRFLVITSSEHDILLIT